MTGTAHTRTGKQRLRGFLARLVSAAKRTLPTGAPFDDSLNYILAWLRLGYLPHVNSPRSLNEHILSSKRRFCGDIGLARRVTDKALFKEWLEEKGYGTLVVPTLGFYESVDELRDLVLAKDTILKPTHLSGTVIVIRDSRKLTSQEAARAKKCLRTDYYKKSRESVYKNIQKQIVHEPLLLDATGNIPMDYKFFMCSGKPLMIQVDMDRLTNHTRQLYSTNWELLDFGLKFPRSPTPIEKPEKLDAALDIAAALSRDFPLCRVDLYLLPDSVIKAGEVTFFPEGGGGAFSPSSADFEMGRKVKELLGG